VTFAFEDPDDPKFYQQMGQPVEHDAVRSQTNGYLYIDEGSTTWNPIITKFTYRNKDLRPDEKTKYTGHI